MTGKKGETTQMHTRAPTKMTDAQSSITYTGRDNYNYHTKFTPSISGTSAAKQSTEEHALRHHSQISKYPKNYSSFHDHTTLSSNRYSKASHAHKERSVGPRQQPKEYDRHVPLVQNNFSFQLLGQFSNLNPEVLAAQALAGAQHRS